jgi:hypothetical protein
MMVVILVRGSDYVAGDGGRGQCAVGEACTQGLQAEFIVDGHGNFFLTTKEY